MVSGLESGANLKRIIRRSKFILAFSLLFRLVRLEFSPRSGEKEREKGEKERRERKKEERERRERTSEIMKYSQGSCILLGWNEKRYTVYDPPKRINTISGSSGLDFQNSLTNHGSRLSAAGGDAFDTKPDEGAAAMVRDHVYAHQRQRSCICTPTSTRVVDREIESY